MAIPKFATAENRLVDDAVVAKLLVTVAFVRVALKEVRKEVVAFKIEPRFATRFATRFSRKWQQLVHATLRRLVKQLIEGWHKSG